jgi:hypothetical protein
VWVYDLSIERNPESELVSITPTLSPWERERAAVVGMFEYFFEYGHGK